MCPAVLSSAEHCSCQYSKKRTEYSTVYTHITSLAQVDKFEDSTGLNGVLALVVVLTIQLTYTGRVV